MFKYTHYSILMLAINSTACSMNQNDTPAQSKIIQEYNQYVAGCDPKLLKQSGEYQADICFLTYYFIDKEDKTVIRVFDKWKGAPVTAHSSLTGATLHIQLSAGFFGGFAVALTKVGERVSATYYESADGTKIFRTNTSQPWKESIDTAMQVVIAEFTEATEHKKKVVYARLQLNTLPFYRNDDITETVDPMPKRVNLGLIIRCTPEQIRGK